MSDGLFPADPLRVDPPEPLSAHRRRTLRQRQVIDAGYHPLLAAAGHTHARLHPNAAPEVCSPDAPKGQPYTCGSCRFREVLLWQNRTYPKCIRWVLGTNLLTAPTITHGPATDVRAWWPACREYEAGDTALSPDAARSIPAPPLDGPDD